MDKLDGAQKVAKSNPFGDARPRDEKEFAPKKAEVKLYEFFNFI